MVICGENWNKSVLGGGGGNANMQSKAESKEACLHFLPRGSEGDFGSLNSY